MLSVSQNWQEVHSLWFRMVTFCFLTTVQSWGMQFPTDKLTVFTSRSEDHKIHKLSQTPLSFHRFSRPWKEYPIFPKLSKTVQTLPVYVTTDAQYDLGPAHLSQSRTPFPSDFYPVFIESLLMLWHVWHGTREVKVQQTSPALEPPC